MLLVDKSYLPNDESNNVGYDSGSDGTCALSFCFEDYVDRVDVSVVHVRDMGSGVFVPIGSESIGDIVLLAVLLPIVV